MDFQGDHFDKNVIAELFTSSSRLNINIPKRDSGKYTTKKEDRVK
jgi:hypothetical protein